MAIQGFDYQEQVLGTGDTNIYTFDFKIFDPSHLHIYVQDASGNILYDIDGTDTSFLQGVSFDSIEGGGTVTLVNDLPDSYSMTILLANDAPDQPSSFPNKLSLTLDAIEGALDYLAAWGQRIAFLAQRALRLHDLDDISAFDMRLPKGLSSNPEASILVNAGGNGFMIGPDLTAISAAAGNAVASALSATAAATQATSAAASATAAAASAATAQLGYFVPAGMTYALPLGITAAGGITPSGKQREMQFIHGNSGPVVVTANPPIVAGTILAQELLLFGCDDTNTLSFTNGNGLKLKGNCTLGDTDMLALIWDGVSNWVELWRNQSS